VRIEFCEADVLDVFDEWRRAVGVAAWSAAPDAQSEATEQEGDAEAGRPRRGRSLSEHLERVVARLTALRAGPDRRLDVLLESIVRELDGARAGAKQLRGAARGALIERLHHLDAVLLEAARGTVEDAQHAELMREADAELEPFRDRMPADAFEQSRRACVDRLVRERTRLPVIAFE
jgi:hypothetical protein